MSRIIYVMAYTGKKIIKFLKFYYKSLEVKLKTNLNKKTEMSYKEAIEVLNRLHKKKKIDIAKSCIRAKEIKYDVSIIVPVYNAEKNLEICIKSLINQKTNYKYEIICVNDGSSDDSLEILHRLSEYEEKIVIVDQTNGGASKARNSGMKIAKGRYFFFVDADDILPEKTIEVLLKAAKRSNADIVQGSIAKCNDNGEIYDVNKCKNERLDNLLEYYNCNMNGTAWGKLYKRELWDHIEFFNGYAYEDAIVWCNVYSLCKRMVYESEVVYIFRSQEKSLFKQQNNSFKCLDAVWIIEQCVHLNDYLKIKQTDDWYQMILWQLSVGIVTRIGYVRNDEVLQAAFIIAKNILETLDGYKKTEFKENKKIYREIENSFNTLEYRKWVEYSQILSYLEKV